VQIKNYVYKLIFLLGNDAKKIPFLITSFVLISLIEILGLGLIAPFVSLILNKDTSVSLNKFLNSGFSANEWILFFIFILVGVFMLKTLLSIFLNFYLISFTENQRLKIRKNLMEKYQNLPFQDYTNKKSSDYIYNIGTASSNYAGNTLFYFLKISSDLIFISAVSIFLMFQNIITFTVMFSLFLSFLIFYNLFFQKKLTISGKESNKANNEMFKFINEAMEGFKDIKIFKIEGFFFKGLEENAKKFRDFIIPSLIISQAPRFLIELIFIIFISLMVLLSINLNFSEEELFSSVVVFSLAGVRLLPIISGISSSLSIIKFNYNTIDIIYDDLKEFDFFKKDTDLSFNKKLVFKSLKLSNVSFKYVNQSEFALKDISLDISSGMSLGIIGKSGSGKSTLVDLLLGFLNPYDGKILINEVLFENTLDAWKNTVAYLPQEVFIINDSLEANIALGEKEIDKDKLFSSIEKAGLSDLVSELEFGINTNFGDRGIKLSGGQRQRIALARAFYKNRNVIFMDEATSALDSESEIEINKQINSLGKDFTKVIISHKQSSVINCDLIIRLEKGKIISTGSPKDFFNK
jgi:ABC-type bacteriocin/lantibiotic exporter with double-glycine peptidase domain